MVSTIDSDDRVVVAVSLSRLEPFDGIVTPDSCDTITSVLGGASLRLERSDSMESSSFKSSSRQEQRVSAAVAQIEDVYLLIAKVRKTIQDFLC